jgi:hypothetical protein
MITFIYCKVASGPNKMTPWYPLVYELDEFAVRAASCKKFITFRQNSVDDHALIGECDEMESLGDSAFL